MRKRTTRPPSSSLLLQRSGEERTDLQCLGLGCAGGERSSSRSPIGGASRSQAACVEAPELRPPDLDPAGASGAAVATTLGRGGGGKGRRGGRERSSRRWRVIPHGERTHGGGTVAHGECGDGCARTGRPTHEVNGGPHAGLAMDTGLRRGAGNGYWATH
jgi:hypothetical protein